MTRTSRVGHSLHGRVAGVLLVTSLLVVLLPIGLAGATPAPSGGSALTVWAYGAVRSVEFQGTSQNGWQYSGNATYGYSVILNQTNLSATSFELSANRTMGAAIEVKYCSPSCHAPKYYGNISDRVYETAVAVSNLTSAGTVDENGAAVAAVALNSTEAHLHSNLTESSSSYLPLAGVGPGVARSHYLGVTVDSTSSVLLTPGLGILPLSLGTAQSWSSSAQFTSQAKATFTYYAEARGPLGSIHVGPTTGNLSVQPSGTVSLVGSYSPANQVTLDGLAYPEISLSIAGPFSLREGFFLVPGPVDLFGGASAGAPWTVEQNGTASASMNYLDARASEGGHVGVGASQWVYDSSTSGPSSPAAIAFGGLQTDLSPALSGDAAPPTTVQGAPESVSTAQEQQACLLTGGNCPSSATGGTGAGLRGTLGFVAAGAVLVLGVAMAVLIAERRRVPPPVYPNAGLYPPGSPAPPSRATPKSPAPSTEEDDPLRNLW